MPSRTRSSWWKWLLLLVLIGGAYAGWSYYRKRAEDAPPEYKTAPIARGDIVQSVTANGQLSAVKNVTVGSQVSGIITDIKVDFNSPVTNGQVIAQIDPSTYQQNITQAEAELASAQAAMELAELDSKRNYQLFTNSLIPASEFDQTVAALHQSQAVVRMREASLRRVQVDLQRTTIYAPIDGVVISRAVDVGQTVAASFNAPVLFNIANDLHNMRIEAMVSEADVGGVREGQKANFTVEAFPGRQFHGQVIQVRYAPVTNQNVVNYTCVVEVNNSDLKLRPGMTANASIITAQAHDVLRLPNAALRFRPPENALVEGRTNNAAASPGSRGSLSNAVAERGGPTRGEGGGPPPGSGERPSREEMRRRIENMTPEQIEEFRARRRERGAGGEGGFSGRGGGGSDGKQIKTVYLLEKKGGKSVLKPVTVTLGISDGAYTEVLDGLKEGDAVLLPSATVGARTAGTPSASPFGRGFGGGFRGR